MARDQQSHPIRGARLRHGSNRTGAADARRYLAIGAHFAARNILQELPHLHLERRARGVGNVLALDDFAFGADGQKSWTL